MNMKERLAKTKYFSDLDIQPDLILDQLTKAVSRRYVLDYIDYLISNKISFSLSILDVDNFKQINDTLGHQFGDYVLKNVTSIIFKELDDDTIVGRYGGDEFIVVSVNKVDYNVRHDMHDKIFRAIRKPMMIEDKEMFITMSCGSSLYPVDADNFDDLFKKADVTLYRAKSKGRNCYVIYDPIKHAGIKIEKNESILPRMSRLASLFSGRHDIYYEIYESLIQISASCGVDGAAIFEVGKNPLIYKGTYQYEMFEIPKDILEESYENNIITVNERKKLDENSRLCNFLYQHEMSSCCIIKLLSNGEYLGYLILFNQHVRMWQEVEVATSMYLASLIGEKIYYYNKK